MVKICSQKNKLKIKIMINKSNLQVQTADSRGAVLSNAEVQKVAAMAEITSYIGNNRSAVIDISISDRPIIPGVKPKSTLIVIEGRNVGDTADIAVVGYAFNEDVYKKSQTSAGVETKATSYNDGFGGKNINRYIMAASVNGAGLKIKEMTFIATDIETGNQDLTVLQECDLALLSYNPTTGRQNPEVFDLAAAIRNTQQQSGVLTVSPNAYVNLLSQLSYTVPAGKRISCNIIWE